jgi:hypothetical protein
MGLGSMGPSLFLPVPKGLPAGGSAAAKLAPAEKDVLLAMALLHQRLGTKPALQLDLAFRVVRSHPECAPAHKLFALAARALGLEPLAIGHQPRQRRMALGLEGDEITLVSDDDDLQSGCAARLGAGPGSGAGEAA